MVAMATGPSSFRAANMFMVVAATKNTKASNVLAFDATALAPHPS